MVFVYLEPIWPLFLGVPEQGHFREGPYGPQEQTYHIYIYIYTRIRGIGGEVSLHINGL